VIQSPVSHGDALQSERAGAYDQLLMQAAAPSQPPQPSDSACGYDGLAVISFYCLSAVKIAVGVCCFLDPEGGSQKAILVVLDVVISSLKIPKTFLIRSAAQRSCAYAFDGIDADISHRSTVSDL